MLPTSGFVQQCNRAQKCKIRALSKPLICKRKRPLCTNVLFFLSYNRREKKILLRIVSRGTQIIIIQHITSNLHTCKLGDGRAPPPAPPLVRLATVRLCRSCTTAPSHRKSIIGGAGVAARKRLQMLPTRLQNICLNIQE